MDCKKLYLFIYSVSDLILSQSSFYQYTKANFYRTNHSCHRTSSIKALKDMNNYLYRQEFKYNKLQITNITADNRKC